MEITIQNFHDVDVTVKVTHVTPFSDRGAHARPGSAAWAEPPEYGEVEFDILLVDTGLELDDCDPEDNVVPITFIKDHFNDLEDRVFEWMSNDDGYED